MKLIRFALILALMIQLQAEAQNIRLSNPSFEGFASQGNLPLGWFDCGFPGESPPDIQPGSWGVEKAAQEGNTYLGMVTRRRDTWECVSQKLESPLRSGQCYMFSVYMRRASHYLSPEGPSSGSRLAEFTQPIKLRIWGGYSRSRGQELLAESQLVESEDWQQFFFKLSPRDDYNYFFLEAFYQTPTLVPYNGNILLDNASDLISIDCGENIEEEVVSKEPFVSFVTMKTKSKVRKNNYIITFETQNIDRKSDINIKMNGNNLREFDFSAMTQKGSFTVDLKEGINNFDIDVQNSFGKNDDHTDIYYTDEKPKEDIVSNQETKKEATTKPVVTPPEKKPTPQNSSAMENKVASARKGQKIVIDKLNFAANESIIDPKSYSILDELAITLKHNPNITIEIGGHTNGMPKDDFCDELSTKRAMAVYNYLVKAGVSPTQLEYKGYGKRNPIATNKTAEGRKRNQRVEIKILKTS